MVSFKFQCVWFMRRQRFLFFATLQASEINTLFKQLVFFAFSGVSQSETTK